MQLCWLARLSNRANNSLSINTNSSAVYSDARFVKPQMSANRMLNYFSFVKSFTNQYIPNIFMLPDVNFVKHPLFISALHILFYLKHQLELMKSYIGIILHKQYVSARRTTRFFLVYAILGPVSFEFPHIFWNEKKTLKWYDI